MIKTHLFAALASVALLATPMVDEAPAGRMHDNRDKANVNIGHEYNVQQILLISEDPTPI